MTDKEASDYCNRLISENPAALAKIIREWHLLKQQLAAQTLGIPTGTDDWLNRTIHRAIRLRECEIQLHKIIRETSSLLAEAKWRAQDPVCFNCMGRTTVGEHSCCICHGTGQSLI